MSSETIGQEPKKSFWKRIPWWGWVVAVAVFLLIGVIGNLTGAGDSTNSRTTAPVSDPPSATLTETPTPTPSAAAEPTAPAPEPAPAPAPDPALDATPSGLTGTYAQSACDQYAENEFPFGYNPAWVFGKIAEAIQGDTWWFKVEAEVKNQYNAEQGIVIECSVGGTNDAPVVQSFIYY